MRRVAVILSSILALALPAPASASWIGEAGYPLLMGSGMQFTHPLLIPPPPKPKKKPKRGP